MWRIQMILLLALRSLEVHYDTYRQCINGQGYE